MAANGDFAVEEIIAGSTRGAVLLLRKQDLLLYAPLGSDDGRSGCRRHEMEVEGSEPRSRLRAMEQAHPSLPYRPMLGGLGASFSERWFPWRLVFLHWVVFSFLFTFKCLVCVYTHMHTHMCHGSRVEVRTISGSCSFLLSCGFGDGSHAAQLYC